jgi:hypothetical protein
MTTLLERPTPETSFKGHISGTVLSSSSSGSEILVEGAMFAVHVPEWMRTGITVELRRRGDRWVAEPA